MKNPFLFIAGISWIIASVCLPISGRIADPFVYWILWAGPLIILPLGRMLMEQQRERNGLLLSASLIWLVSYCISPGVLAASLAGLWLLFTLNLLYEQWRSQSRAPLLLAAFLFLVIGAAWSVADRLGYRPLGFNPLIVLLTAVHFHYAGFALSLLAHLQTQGNNRRILEAGIWVGVPAVAIGITVTQLNGPVWVEALAVSMLVVTAYLLAFIQLRSALQKRRPLSVRILWGMGSIALLIGMSLALAYGWRFQLRWEWLTMPFMYATHGVLNSLGFALLSLVGWGIHLKRGK